MAVAIGRWPIEQRSTATANRQLVVLSSRGFARHTSMNVKKRLLDGARMTRAIRRMAIEILEKKIGRAHV